jgi:hypothetical protein
VLVRQGCLALLVLLLLVPRWQRRLMAAAVIVWQVTWQRNMCCLSLAAAAVALVGLHQQG